MDEINNYVQEIRDLTREAALPDIGEKIHYVAVPTGMELKSLKDFQYPHGLPPDRIIAAPKFQDAPSFCSYINLYKDDRTRLFADAPLVSFRAIIDYHGVGADRKAEFLSHQATLTLKLSEEWKLWIGQNDKLVSQSDFAEFLEDNRADIVSPDSATFLEIARDLQAHSDVNFVAKVNSINGAATLQYEETIKATVSMGRIEVPESFTIRIPVFFGESAIDITARLRFRIDGGKLKFHYKLYRPTEVLSKAFDVARTEISSAVTMDCLLGTL